MEPTGDDRTWNRGGYVRDQVLLGLGGDVDQVRPVQHLALPEPGADGLAKTTSPPQVRIQRAVGRNDVWNAVPQRSPISGELRVLPEIVDVHDVIARNDAFELPLEGRRI